MPLPTESVIEIPLTAPNQQGVPTTAPVGELNYIKNGIVEKFDSDGKLRVQKRQAFKRLTTDIRSPDTGAQITAAGFENPPNLLSSLAQQVVVAADAAPHVLAESALSWSKYDHVYSPLSLKQKTIYGANAQIANPDVANIGGVRLYSWSEPLSDTIAPTGRLILLMVDANGTRIMFQAIGNGNIHNRAKVVADGTRFWVAYNQADSVIANAYDTNGQLLDTDTFETLDDTWDSWDLTYSASTVLFVRANGETARVTKLTYSSGIVPLSTDMGFVALADHGVAWAEDVTGTSSAYLLTSHIDPDNGTVERAFRIGTLSGTPSVTGYYSIPQTSGSGIIYELDGEGGYTGVLNEMTGVLMSDGFHIQLSFFDASDHRQDRMVFILATAIGATATVQATQRSTRSASRTFPLESGRQAIVVFYPSALTTVIAANGANPPRAFGGNPTYFILDVETRQIVGRINDGQAGMEWTRTFYPIVGPARPVGPFMFCVPHVFVDSDSITHIPVGVNGENISRSETRVLTGQDIVSSLTVTKVTSAVRFAELQIGNLGQAQEYKGRLFMPGALATEFDGQDFREQGINLPIEQPSAAKSTTGGTHLTLLSTYSHIAVLEGTNNQGDRVRSAISIPVETTLTGTQDTITLTGLIQHMTNWVNLTIAIYRNVIDAGVPSSIHYKISSDLAPLVNLDGNLTWIFIDAFTDVQAIVGEKLYAGKFGLGLADRDPFPAFDAACIGENRIFAVGPDNYIHFTCEASDSYPLWYNIDTHKFPMPTDDPVIRCEWMDQRLFLLCKTGIWWVPAGRWPGPDGLGGNMQAPVKLPWNNGCTGHSKVIDKGIAYGSSAGGVWLITRGLENVQLSAGLTDEFDANRPVPIGGITVDEDQRVAVALERGADPQKVFDQKNAVWSSWYHETDVLHTHTVRGKLAYADTNSVKVQTIGQYMDDPLTIGNPAVWYDFEAEAEFSLMNIKGLKRVWAFLVSGVRRAAHNLTLLATYVTEDLDVTESWEFESNPAERFDNEFQPKVEEMSKMTVKITDGPSASPAGSDTGDSFAWDLTSFTVGTEGGLVRTPPSTRRRQST